MRKMQICISNAKKLAYDLKYAAINKENFIRPISNFDPRNKIQVPEDPLGSCADINLQKIALPLDSDMLNIFEVDQQNTTS